MKQHFTWILAGLILGGLLGKATVSYAQGGTWVVKSDMQTPRWAFSMTTVDGLIYTIGGSPNNMEALSTVEAYNPVTDTWTAKADLPTARWYLATSEVAGKIYVIGGVEPPFDSVLAVEEYDPTTDTWTKKGGHAYTQMAVCHQCDR